MPLLPSTLGADMVPAASRDQYKYGGCGKYKSKLQDGLVPAVPTRDEYPDAGTKPPKYKSSLAPDLTAVRPPVPAAAPSDAPPNALPKKFQSRAHLLPYTLPAPPVSKAPSQTKKEQLVPRTNIFTGDDIEPLRVLKPARDEAWAYKKLGTPSTEHIQKREQRCVFTGDDLPPQQDASEQWQYMRRWKSKTMMPEGLGGIPGFGPSSPNVGDEANAAADDYERSVAAAAARIKQDWESERVWREDRQTDANFDMAKRREDVDKLVANKAENVWGMREPPRKKGELLTPFAPRH